MRCWVPPFPYIPFFYAIRFFAIAIFLIVFDSDPAHFLSRTRCATPFKYFLLSHLLSVALFAFHSTPASLSYVYYHSRIITVGKFSARLHRTSCCWSLLLEAVHDLFHHPAAAGSAPVSNYWPTFVGDCKLSGSTRAHRLCISGGGRRQWKRRCHVTAEQMESKMES